MKLSIVLITKIPELMALVEAQGINLIPIEIRRSMNLTLDISIFNSSQVTNDMDFLKWLKAHISNLNKKPESIIIIKDKSMPGLLNKISNQFSISDLPIKHDTTFDFNFLSSSLIKHLKNFNLLYRLFINLKYNMILRLPLKNFHSVHFERIKELCKMITSSSFYNDLEIELKEIIKSKVPKRSTSSSKKYIIDEKEYFFTLGQHHGEPETKIPPHNIICNFSKEWRFGINFDPSEHYDVTRDKKKSVKGLYFFCHGEKEFSERDSHINIFPNDYFK